MDRLELYSRIIKCLVLSYYERECYYTTRGAITAEHVAELEKRAFEKSKITNILDYQKDQLDTALSYCKHFRHSIDIGANYGLMSANMSKVFTKVSAFEIVPEINNCFKKNVKKC